MKIAILGFGLQGKSALAYFSKNPANQITICYQKIDKVDGNLPADVQTRRGEDFIKNLNEFDLIVRAPSVHPKDIVSANDNSVLNKVTTNTNEFFKVCPTRNIIGVTGTKGKGTTSSLIAKMLEAAGKTVHLGGNIGTPPLDMLKNIKPEDYIVLELANFQLIDIKYSPRIAVCLMVAPEHMDWHSDMDEYITAKKQLFRWHNSNDVAIYNAKNSVSRQIADIGKGRKIPYYAPPGAIIDNDDVVIGKQSICSTDEIKLLGKHNWQNICAAITAVWFSLSSVDSHVNQYVEAIRSVATTFTGLEHRLEFVRELDGVNYYNDSFAASPGATIAAIDAIANPKVLIVGGLDKGLDLTELAETISSHRPNIRKVIVIGNVADRIAKELQIQKFDNYEILKNVNMTDIVNHARRFAKAGDNVILSPASSSFDMFKNFEDRGNQFKESVNAL